MNMKSLMIAALVLGTVGCKRMSGTMQITDDVTINTKKGAVTLGEGNYATTVSASSSSTKVKLKGNGGSYTVKLPAIPELQNKWGEGRIYLKGSQIGQPFDVAINLDVSTGADSGTISRTESCVYDTRTYQDWVCRPGHDTVCDRDGECHTIPSQDCGWETRTETIYGDQEVEGYYSTTRRSAELRFVRARVVGRLVDNSQSKSRFNVTYTGPCRR
jgi:hypothetical protein